MTDHESRVDCDVAIAGGGLVGASLALALAPLGLKVALVEAVAPGGGDHPSFDERTTALANGSARIFRSLGIWRHMEREATPIRRIHVSDQGRFGVARIDAAEQGLEALGYVLPNRVMGAALWQGLAAASGIQVIAPARVLGSELTGDVRVLALEHSATTQQLRARLVVAADGARSLIREQAGIAADHWPYAQTAIIATITTQRFHDYVAYERFTADGPIAVLPLSDGRCGIVWTRPPEDAARLLALPDEAFLAELQAAFGFRLGRLLRAGVRSAYELALSRSERHVAERLAIVGNAAQGLHPIAGQGFNLGLRDAASLAEVLADARAAGSADAGDAGPLKAYADWRAEDRRRIVAFTDGLVRLFGSPLGVLRGLRSVGLLAFDAFPPAKSAMARLSVGAAGRIPRLARGVPLAGDR
ncbi:MAG TPA: 2-octaprenyl-6-methoxyphenyl hydroxylase [Steroidobacteraceae bacterium]|nr:2-octaprenyl-6-methoxyphenyl hydroxylase [Steroidobacteraceae bacterium]